MLRFFSLFTLLAALLLLATPAARAEPYLALGQGVGCGTCHVNPTGGGLRNAYGAAYTRNLMPAYGLPDSVPAWTGGVTDWLRLGTDLRTARTSTRVPGQPAQTQNGLQQWRAYVDVQVLPGIVGLALDEQLRPGKPTRQEAYLRLTTPDQRFYAKAGQFYLPFGWRLQDNTAFVRSVSGISMTTPDKGVELGYVDGPWSAQLTRSRGPGNVGGNTGHQTGLQLVHLQADWRVGAGLADTQSSAGNRRALALFGGLRTGPLVWLGEADWVGDSGYPEGRRRQFAGLAEVNWGFSRGQNLKLSTERLDPDRAVANDHKTRLSLLYELTPLPYVQLRAGWRRNQGIPQNAFDNRRTTFVELHAFM